ncbi:hypothetical protein LOZ12_004374 [Ophidiomyces ophidiicola]|uniref:Uncharacterized protein n=1 Tax=Ophidiomyces ophidiicola TaxID=1387563 RepID=A0ACB8UUA4_9EURO|nr:uncharacterized protein LOZ57_001231 [Ophidiomyces ophidiicola]KAI1907667.1 hypothetical protein LOZ61_005999 [Ophidiomyces ophidiicola]KAI1910886.1 hypothetical protein LOZ64_004836 [Ophidiomyces ophidiicola]KAI1925298.1 hypothetical protein LOZ60_004239 [Ophidiomyces ophidiicola]KAI1937442.1 hypothetical protein LOZ62_005462 [Ophidiomyces ophidiicola]KAI1951819.1 hypothetical protein LOZ57_001231 [Ophidiomyces ophidiicola]
MSSAPVPSSDNRRPYHGSCHCGKVRYLAFVSLPPTVGPKVDPKTTVRFYKCNCTTCHKMGYFHMRLPNPAQDFCLLSPSNPKTDLSVYNCFEGKLNWFFCSTCGVRCFTAGADGLTEEIDLEVKLGKPSEGKMTKIWRMDEHNPGYHSVNAHTIDQDQEGFDLRDFSDKKWVKYLDCKEEVSPGRYNYPQNGGTW